MLRAALFDLDGTLIESHTSLRTAYAEFLDVAGVAGDGGGFLRWDGASLRDVVDTLVSEHGLLHSPDELLGRYQGIVRGHYEESTALASGAMQLLDLAETLGLRRALVTSASRAVAEPLLERLDLSSRFDVIIAAEDVTRTKPSAEPYRVALERLGVSGAEAVVVEDSTSGVQAASAAGIACIAVGSPNRASALRVAGAGVVVAGLEDAATVLRALVRFPGRVLRARHIVVRCVGPMASISDADERRLVVHFENARGERPTLTDESVASMRAWRIMDEVLEVDVERASYRHVLGRKAGIASQVLPVGVTGLLKLREREHGEPQLVLGRRSSQVTQYPDFWECVPSGGLAVEGEQVDATAQLRTELAEELWLPAGTVVEIMPLGLIEDVAEPLVDLAYRIDAVVPTGTLSAVRSGPEYVELALLHARDVEGFLTRYTDQLVPTVRALIELSEGTP